nr:hypothetical protein [Tanacetum cinerariifolium]
VANSTTEAEYVAIANCCGQAYTYYCQLKVNVARHKLTTAIDVIAKAKNINREAHIHAKVDGKKVIISEATIRRDLKFKDERGVDCLSNEVIFEQLPLMGEDNLKLNELMKLCTKLSERVLNLKTTKTTQVKEISSLKKRIKRLEKKKKSRTHRLKRLYKIGLSARVDSFAKEQSLDEEDASKQERNIVDNDANADTILVDETVEDQGRYDYQEMFDTYVLNDEEEPSETLTTTTTIPISSKVQDKGKRIMVEESLKMKKKDQFSFDEQEARILQAEFDEQDKLEEEKAQLIEDENLAWDNVQAMMDADCELAARSKKQKVEDDKEQEELKRCLEIISDDGDDVTIDATPLSIKTPIIDYKIYKVGKKSYFQIFRADGNSQMYYTFSKMLKNFDREDLEVLWSIVKARFEKLQPADDMDSFLLSLCRLDSPTLRLLS